MEYTPEQLEEAHKIVAAEQQRQADIAKAKREAYLLPVKELIGSDEWEVVLTKLKDITENFEADNLLSVHVMALSEIMPRLVEVVGFSEGA